MDEAFLLRAQRMLDAQRRARLDHDSFVAQVSARQAATPTAIISAAARAAPSGEAADSAAASLILGQDDWRQARIAQAGCFNRPAATRRVNTP